MYLDSVRGEKVTSYVHLINFTKQFGILMKFSYCLIG